MATLPIPQVRELFYNAFGLTDEHLFSHGLFKGKLSLGLFDALEHKPDGHYVVVVGINPTPLGEGKSTATTNPDPDPDPDPDHDHDPDPDQARPTRRSRSTRLRRSLRGRC